MKFTQFFFVCLISFSSATIPKSPCPELFEYERQDPSGTLIGLLTLGGYRSGYNNTLKVVLSMHAYTLSSGSIQLENLKDLPQEPARFIIHFPASYPVPILNTITFNGEQICSGPPAKGHPVTTIYLDNYVILPELDHESDSSEEQSEEFVSTVAPTITVDHQSAHPYSIHTRKEYCGRSVKHVKPLIMHGTKTANHDWPWLSAIYYKNRELASFEFRCGGTLISPKLIVTAAHCLLSTDGKTHVQANELLVSLGRYNIMDWTEPGAKSFYPRALKIHSNYQIDLFDYDIGAITLPENVAFTNWIRPICLWNGPTDEAIIVSQLGTVVGWGFTELGVVSETPKSVQLPIVSEVDCIRADTGLQLTTSKRTFCAGGLGTGPCQGDSGSGLYLWHAGHWVLRGIVSHALVDPDTGKCDARKYSVYTDVAKFRDWLDELSFQPDS